MGKAMEHATERATERATEQSKTVVVTGGAGGIGRCIAETFLESGDRVFIIDSDRFACEQMKKIHGNKPLVCFAGDVGDRDSLEAFIRSVEEETDSVDVLVNNACFSMGGLETCDYEAFSKVLSVGVTAPFYLTKRFLPRFSGGASVVNIASTRAFMSQKDTESYSAAKGGISALTHAMSLSLAGKVRVNAISPGWIDTSGWHFKASGEENELKASKADVLQHPAGRIGRPEDIASLVKFLTEDSASFIDGENIIVDGGMSRQMIYHNDEGWTYRP
jgi:NAD(P)-dependent dehydrogenase (short-subunit alcohol dehydrogenase family)